MSFRDRGIEIKTPEQIAQMRIAGLLVGETLEVLRSADLIACEDTRHTIRLLQHYQIHRPLISLNEHNEARRTPEIIERIRVQLALPDVPLFDQKGNAFRFADLRGRVVLVTVLCDAVEHLTGSDRAGGLAVDDAFLGLDRKHTGPKNVSESTHRRHPVDMDGGQ